MKLKAEPNGFCIGSVDANSGEVCLDLILETACLSFINTCARRSVKAYGHLLIEEAIRHVCKVYHPMFYFFSEAGP